jgi:hypothetical protein
MIPAQVMADARQQAAELLPHGKPISRAGAFMVIAIWLILITTVVGVYQWSSKRQETKTMRQQLFRKDDWVVLAIAAGAGWV